MRTVKGRAAAFLTLLVALSPSFGCVGHPRNTGAAIPAHIGKVDNKIYFSIRSGNDKPVHILTISVEKISGGKSERYFWSAHSGAPAGSHTEMPIIYGSSGRDLQTELGPVELAPGKYRLFGEAFIGKDSVAPRAFSKIFCLDHLLSPVDADQCN